MINNGKIEMKYLTEAGITVDPGYWRFLDEATKTAATDLQLTEMFKFITDKYNSIDFSEIDKSAGDYKKFKYKQLVDDNLRILTSVYASTDDVGAEKFKSTIKQINELSEFLLRYREEFTFLYRSKVGIAQVLYTSMVSSIVYATSALVANTIRFITVEDDSDLSVVYDDMNNAAKNIHVKNITRAVNSMDAFSDYIETVYRSKRTAPQNEAALTIGAIAGIVGATLIVVPRIIPFIREVIYSIYFSRVKFAQALEVQIELIRTNIESLEDSGRGAKKVIARQKNTARRLEKLMNIVAVKMDDAESMSTRRQLEENKSLKIDRNSALASSDASALLL